MSNTLEVFGNIENALVGWIRGQYTTDQVKRVVTELPASLDTSLPLIQLNVVNGNDPLSYMATDIPIIDIDVWAPDRTSGLDLAADLRARLKGLLPNSVLANEAITIQWVRTFTRPRVVPDSNPNLRRISATYEIGYRY